MRIFRLMEGETVLDEMEVESDEDLPTPTSNEQVWVEVPFTSPPLPAHPRCAAGESPTSSPARHPGWVRTRMPCWPRRVWARTRSRHCAQRVSWAE